MMKGSKNSCSSASKSVAPDHRIGFVIEIPEKTSEGEGNYEKKGQVSFADKQSGCYGRATAKEKASSKEFQWKNGKSGTRNEFTESTTVRIGDKSGYTEVYKEKRVRDVIYNKSTGNKKVITYDDDDDDGGYEHPYGHGHGYGCRYGYGYGYASDSD